MPRIPEGYLKLTCHRTTADAVRNLSANPLPSDDAPVIPLDISSAVNSTVIQVRAGRIRSGNLTFEVPAGRVVAASGEEDLPVGQDVSSLIFLHACTRPARNAQAYTGTWNYADTATLIGWYEAEYEDGFVENIPVRYGWNILEAGWNGNRPERSVAYETEMVDGGPGTTLFAYEWINPRFGKPVKEVRLHQAVTDNPVTLAELKIVKKRVAPEPKP